MPVAGIAGPSARWWLLVAGAGLVLLACRAHKPDVNGTKTQVAAQPDAAAGSSASPKPDAAVTDASARAADRADASDRDSGKTSPASEGWPAGCAPDPGGWVFEWQSPTYSEPSRTPDNSTQRDPNNTDDEYTVSLESRLVGEGGGTPTVVYSGINERGIPASVLFILLDPYDVRDLVGQTVHFRFYGNTLFDCLGAGDLSTAEPERTVVRTLRDSDDKLIIVGATTALMFDGTIVWKPELVPEISLAVLPTPDDPCEYRHLSLEVKDPATGAKAHASWNQRAEIMLDGEPYVLAVIGAAESPGSGRCGGATWALYQKGLFVR